jgi:RHS repeat-associated protein
VNLRQHLIYGDMPESGLSLERAIALNLLGKPYQLYDEAGRVTIEAYDFKGNVLEKGRQAIADAAIMTVFDAPPEDWRIQPFQIDWQPPQDGSLEKHASGLLEAKTDRTSLTYDGLNRVKLMQYPEDVEGQRKVLRPEYNRAGALERVLLDQTPYLEQIAYNAKGQRTLVVYGNGVMTRHAYDAQTFRLVRLRTERFTQPSDLVYQPKGGPLQDFAYRYDLVGNILEIQARTPESGIPNTLLGTDALDRAFTYDPIYRLLSATGREADRPPELPDWLDQPRGTDATRTRGYTERYQYDVAGNMLQLQHQTQNDSFNRDFALEAINNRLKTVSKGEMNFTYTYDVNGNLIQENKSRYFEWNHSDQLRSFRTQAGTSEPSVYAHYLYDAAGERVKKLVRKQGGEIEVTVYIDGLFEYHRTVQGSSTHENNSLHVMDDQSRIALVRVGKAFPDDQTPAVKFHLGDHLGSSNVVVDDAGALINREEYTPYGETSFGSFAKKRYRFTGKERDEESGLNYHSARYYSPWLARWMSCDPAGMVDGVNLYRYVRNNPILLVDPAGLAPKPSPEEQQKLEQREKLCQNVVSSKNPEEIYRCVKALENLGLPQVEEPPRTNYNCAGSIDGRPYSYNGPNKYGCKKSEMAALGASVKDDLERLADSPLTASAYLIARTQTNDPKALSDVIDIAWAVAGIAAAGASLYAGYKSANKRSSSSPPSSSPPSSSPPSSSPPSPANPATTLRWQSALKAFNTEAANYKIAHGGRILQDDLLAWWHSGEHGAKQAMQELRTKGRTSLPPNLENLPPQDLDRILDLQTDLYEKMIENFPTNEANEAFNLRIKLMNAL